MTVDELKAEAAKLPPDDRFALAEWIERSDDVRALRREGLIREIRHGIERADRRELPEADEVFPQLRAGHEASTEFLATELMLRRRRELSDEVMSGKVRIEFPHFETVQELDRKRPLGT